MKYAALRDPRSLANTESLLAIPLKRSASRLVGYLSLDEMNAILKAPDPATWSGQRDRVMFATFYNTGARVSEVCQIRVCDVDLDHSRSVKLHGKGRRKEVLRSGRIRFPRFGSGSFISIQATTPHSFLTVKRNALLVPASKIV